MTTLSACLIVRDEESCLEACLESLRPFVDEIVVLDTGSEDGTLEIARRLADRVEERPWGADFSEARNAALELVTGDFVLSIDADETLDPMTGANLRQAVEAGGTAWLVRVESDLGGRTQVSLLPRLFARKPEIRFSRPVHESVMESLIAAGVTELEDSGGRLFHSGYTGERVGAKRARNLLLLRKRALEAPEDLYNTYKLAVTLRDTDQVAEQLSTFEVAHRLAEAVPTAERGTYPFLPLVYAGFGANLVEHGRLAHAARVLDRGLELFGDCAELLFRRADLARRTGDAERARRLYRETVEHSGGLPLHPTDPYARTLGPYVGMARLAAEFGDAAATMTAVEDALRVDPDDAESRCLGVRAQLAGDDAETGITTLESLTQERPEDPHVRLLAGEVALARGDYDTAVDLWRANTLRPGDEGRSARARLTLALLATGRLTDAAEHLPRLVDADLETAATRLVLSVVGGAAYEPDEALSPALLLERSVPLLRELLEGPTQEAAAAFAQNAPLYAEKLPGVDELLVAEETSESGARPAPTS